MGIPGQPSVMANGMMGMPPQMMPSVQVSAYYLQCFDAVGWAAGRASGL